MSYAPVGQLVGRRCRLTIALPTGSFAPAPNAPNAVVIQGSDDATTPGMRVAFKIVKTAQKEPNPAEITVYNLAEATRNKLNVKGLLVQLEAGYVTTGMTLIYQGDSRTTDHVREGADWKTVIKCGDGERAYRHGRVALAFGAGVTAQQVASGISQSMGLGLGNLPTKSSQLGTQLFHGWTAHGHASSELDRVARATGLSWSIQDGQVQFLGPDESVAVSVPLISPSTGLIGSPEMGSPEKKGKQPALKFKSLILPARIVAGGRVALQSARYNGIFRTRRATFTGDVHGNDWDIDFDSVVDNTVAVA